MGDRPDVTHLARLVLDKLTEAGIETALGGALCLGYWAIPRGTLDIDVTVFLPESELDKVFEVVAALGGVVDPQAARRAVAERGMFDVWVHGVRLDVFIPDIPLYDTARTRLRTVSFAGRPARIWSAEDIVLFKLMYFRSKDRVDIEAVISFQGSALDAGYVLRWLEDLVGPDDERTAWFRQATKS